MPHCALGFEIGRQTGQWQGKGTKYIDSVYVIRRVSHHACRSCTGAVIVQVLESARADFVNEMPVQG